MLKILFFIFLSFPFTIKSQTTVTVNTKNSIHYKSKLISEILIQNYSDFNDNGKVIYDRALGIDVDIYVDTVFKKYTVIFLDQTNSKQIMIYTYIRNYFLDSKPNKGRSKMYLMEFGGVQFMLIDFSEVYPMDMIEIRYDKKQAENTTLMFRIKNVEKAN